MFGQSLTFDVGGPNPHGQANASITLAWYAHPDDENDEREATLISSLLASGDGDKKGIKAT